MLTPGVCTQIDRHALAARTGELDQTIRGLGAIRDGLRHAAECPAASHLECPTFRRLALAVAGAVDGKTKRTWHFA